MQESPVPSLPSCSVARRRGLNREQIRWDLWPLDWLLPMSLVARSRAVCCSSTNGRPGMVQTSDRMQWEISCECENMVIL